MGRYNKRFGSPLNWFCRSSALVSHYLPSAGGIFPLTLFQKNMYTLEQLQGKSLNELKEIGY